MSVKCFSVAPVEVDINLTNWSIWANGIARWHEPAVRLEPRLDHDRSFSVESCSNCSGVKIVLCCPIGFAKKNSILFSRQRPALAASHQLAPCQVNNEGNGVGEGSNFWTIPTSAWIEKAKRRNTKSKNSSQRVQIKKGVLRLLWLP
jgi:hypothetical protein